MTRTVPRWATGLALLRDRHARLPELLRRALAARPEVPSLAGVRAVVTTGVGSSLAHARYLAWLLRERCGVPAWDAPTGAWLEPPGAPASDCALVVFSQGLSPNARFPLAHAGRYRLAVLVTAADADSPDRAAVAQDARARGVVVVPLGCPPEYDVLLRVTGPMLGYAAALHLANAAGAGVDPAADAVAEAVEQAAARMGATLSTADPSVLSDPITFVATSGYGALAHNLAAKVQEGMYLGLPGAVDALELAHGPLQEAVDKRRTFLALARGGSHEAALFTRARATLDPQHRWLEAEAHLPPALTIFEHEAALNALVLTAIAARELDQCAWPGKGRDGPLYSLGSVADVVAPLPPASPAPRPPATHRLAALTWPEIERRIEGGARTVVIPLGATEQHGPHLALDVDTRIADALAERFCLRVDGALATPALAIGCSSEHGAFAGTLSLSATTLAAVLGDVIASLVAHGFEHVVVFSAHGGNDAPLADAEGALRERARPATLTIARGIDRIAEVWQASSAREGVPSAACGHHAGEYETSIIAALAPAAVRWDEVRAGADGDVPDPQRLFYPSVRASAPEGVLGDPRLASAERAERYLAAWVDFLVAQYRARSA